MPGKTTGLNQQETPARRQAEMLLTLPPQAAKMLAAVCNPAAPTIP
jgi:hypothetical protein